MLMQKDNLSSSKNSTRERSPRQKNHSKSSQQQQQQQNRDCLKIVNEKNAANLHSAEAEDDSESENLSPLLNNKNKNLHSKTGKKCGNSVNSAMGAAVPQSKSALHIDGVHEPIDDTDTDAEDRDHEVQEKRILCGG